MKSAETQGTEQEPSKDGGSSAEPNSENKQSSAAREGSKDSDAEEGQTQAEAKQPEPKESAGKSQETGDTEQEPSKEEGSSSEDEEITLEVVTRLDRRIRGGVTVTQAPQTVSVTKEVAALLEADPHISASRK
ncbi:MAG: hypothetical protein HLX50_07625 [Alteromonadaceae bacterium]|nr:hypothetical protein [Alteromonadaceae bacterium]